MKIEIELPEVPGFEYTGEYREPTKGEWFLTADESKPAFVKETSYTTNRHILRKLPKWRDATVEDAIRAIRGEKVVAKFYDNRCDQSVTATIAGYVLGRDFPWTSNSPNGNWKHCQILES